MVAKRSPHDEARTSAASTQLPQHSSRHLTSTVFQHRPIALGLLAGLLAWCGCLQADECPAGKVLMVRGMFTVFSLGLDDMASQMREEGVDVEVIPASLSGAAVDRIAQQYAHGELTGPLVLVGHSLGGDLAPGLARRFGRHCQTVDLLVMIDSTNPSYVPANVKRCLNLYQSNSSPTWFRVFRGMPIDVEDEATELANVDIRELANCGQADGINHFNIEASPWIHELVIAEIARTMGFAPTQQQASASDSLVDESVAARPAPMANAPSRLRIQDPVDLRR